MALILQLIKLGLPFVVETGLKKSQSAQQMMLKILGSVFAIIGVIFSLVALHQYLSTLLPPSAVSLYFASGFFLVSALLFLIVVIKKQKKPQGANLFSHKQWENVAQEGLDAAEQLKFSVEKGVRDNKGKLLLLGAVITAVVIGNRMSQRSKKEN